MNQTSDEQLPDERDQIRPLLLVVAPALVLAIPVLILWATLFSDILVDDAFIAYRFSENWASEAGLTWNAGEDPVEGFTSFAWVALGAVMHRISGTPLDQFMHFAGLFSWFLLAAFFSPLCLRRLAECERPIFREISTTTLIVAILTSFAIIGNVLLGLHSMHGLETMLQVLMFAAIAWLALGEADTRRLTALSFTAFLSFTVRPDALAFVFPVYAMLLIHAGRKNWKNILVSLAVCCVAVAIYTLLKWYYFGHPVPNTAYIKMGTEFFAGLGYVRDYLYVFFPLALFLLYAGARGGFVTLVIDRKLSILLIPALAFTLAYTKFQPAMGFGFRFLSPTIPLYILATFRAYTLAEAEFWHHRPLPKWTPARYVTGTAIVYLLILGFFSFSMSREAYDLGRGMTRGAAIIDYVHGVNGRNLAPASHLDPPPLLGTGDVGECPYYSGLPTVDLIGLCDERIAHEGALTHEYLLERDCDLYILQNLYFKERIPVSPTGFSTESVVLNIDGINREVDMSRYQRTNILDGTAHTGEGTTYQVITSPGFVQNYQHVGNWPYGTRDHYYAFLKKEYPHFLEVSNMLDRGEHNVEDKLYRISARLGITDNAILDDLHQRYLRASPTPPALQTPTSPGLGIDELEEQFGYSVPPIREAALVLNPNRDFYAMGWVTSTELKNVSARYNGRSYPAKYMRRGDIEEKFGNYPFRTGWIVEIPSSDLSRIEMVEFYLDDSKKVQIELYVAK